MSGGWCHHEYGLLEHHDPMRIR